MKRLIADGHEVTALARSERVTSALQKLGVQKVVTGHLLNIPEWASSLQGHDVVIHCAAPDWGMGNRAECHPGTPPTSFLTPRTHPVS